MSIQTEIDRISGNVSAALSAITEKGVTVPDGSTSDALAELITSIEVGGIRIEQGSVTFVETTNSYRFVNDEPDIFIAYVEDDSRPQYNSSKYVWAFIQDTRRFTYHGNQRLTAYYIGYNDGTKKYYTPFKGTYSSIGKYIVGDFASALGAKTYKWYAIYGVTAT